MILLFAPEPPELKWCLVGDAGRTAHTTELTGDWLASVEARLPDDVRLDAIGHLLHQGGDLFVESAEAVTPETIERVETVANLDPEHDRITASLLKYWAKSEADVRQVLFCDTAFFAGLPAEVRDYALPPEITRRGIHRRGGNGLCHEQSWEQARELTDGKARKVISVYLGDRPDLAAVEEGKAVETTAGLTRLEGVLSAQGCGDIDPTIIFQLGASGINHSAINSMLSTQSGFAGLAGRPCSLVRLLVEEEDPDVMLARRVLVYQLVKYVGAFMSVLGGADTLIFAAEQPFATLPLAREVCDALGFLGVRCDWGLEPGRFPHLVSTESSSLSVLLMRYDLWETMAKRTSQLVDRSKEMKE